MIRVATPWSTAEIYLYGAHVAQFQKHGDPSLLFLSRSSVFVPGKPIRGGIPVIFPWFGQRADKPGMHGVVRTRDWDLADVAVAADGRVAVRFRLPEQPESTGCAVEFTVTVADTLGAELAVANQSAAEIEFESCLHTYFTVGDIDTVSIAGLNGVDYLDKVEAFKRKTETNDAIRIASEVDRVYLDTPHAVEIRDGSLRRAIRIEKENSLSTVVWNPWVAKARAMPDFGDEEYKHMICVESGNVSLNPVKLGGGQTSRLKVLYSSLPLK